MGGPVAADRIQHAPHVGVGHIREPGAGDELDGGVDPPDEIGRAGAEHGDSVDPATGLQGIVVDESDGLVVIVGDVRHVAYDHLARIARAVDENARLSGRPAKLPVHPAREPDSPEQADEEHGEMFVPVLAEFGKGNEERILKAARESMELYRVFRLGLALAMEAV